MFEWSFEVMRERERIGMKRRRGRFCMCVILVIFFYSRSSLNFFCLLSEFISSSLLDLLPVPAFKHFPFIYNKPYYYYCCCSF